MIPAGANSNENFSFYFEENSVSDSINRDINNYVLVVNGSELRSVIGSYVKL